MPTGIYKRTRFHSQRISEGLTGKKHPLWRKQNQSRIIKKMYQEHPEYKQVKEASPHWKGDFIGLSQVHKFVRANKPKPKCCEICGKEKQRLVVHNPSQTYKRKIEDYQWICYSCHAKFNSKANRDSLDLCDCRHPSFIHEEKSPRKCGLCGCSHFRFSGKVAYFNQIDACFQIDDGKEAKE